MIGFQLGREYKLSVAEIMSVFPKGETVYLSKDFIILDNLKPDKVLKHANKLGGTIKIVEIFTTTNKVWISNITDMGLKSEGKFKYGLSIFGAKKNLREILIKQKKELKENNISSRFVNKDFKNLSSAQIIGEKLIDRNSDFSYIYADNNIYFGVGIWIQDINAYSKRDYSKERDMQTGMLPPKLCQMMINISEGKIIYDPFVGLGTILIEAILIGSKEVYGSDLNEKMVEITTNNINLFIKSADLDPKFKIIKLNSKFIDESEILINKNIDSIVSEGYLGEMMTQKNISIDRINKQIESLKELYNRFFKGLQTINYKGNLVICFPFWEINDKHIYFNEIYEILDKYCEIKNLFPKGFGLDTTKSGSLLYKREKQLVGREIFKLKMK